MKTLLNPGDGTHPVFIRLAAMLLLSLFVCTVHAQDAPVRVIRSENPRCHSDPPLIYKMAYRFAWNIQNMAIDPETGVVMDSARVRLAIRLYTNIIEACPIPFVPYGSRGLAYFRLGNYDAAYADYHSALDICPEDAWALSNLGFIHFLRNELPQAEQVYRSAVTFDPEFLDARRNLGVVYALQKRFQEAIDEWKTGLKFDPDNATLLFYIGSAYKDLGQEEESNLWLEKAYQMNPGLKN